MDKSKRIRYFLELKENFHRAITKNSDYAQGIAFGVLMSWLRFGFEAEFITFKQWTAVTDAATKLRANAK